MKKFNKATAAAISSAITGVLAAFFPEFQEAVAAIGVLITTGLVFVVRNDA